MALTENIYTGDGTTVLFSFTFPYIDESHVKVSLNGTITTEYTLANATTVQMTTAPGAGVSVRVFRDTDSTALEAEFFPGSAIRAQDLNDNFTQVLYKTQETENFAASTDAAAIAEIAEEAVNTADSAVSIANAATATANSVFALADAALPKAGGTLTGNVNNTSTGYFDLPVGTSVQRPVPANAGMVRFNTEIGQYEGHNGSSWGTIGGGAKGGDADQVFFENDQTVTTNYTITSGKNALSAGPVTVGVGVTVTVPSGSVWSIV
jgi:hypothetical protein